MAHARKSPAELGPPATPPPPPTTQSAVDPDAHDTVRQHLEQHQPALAAAALLPLLDAAASAGHAPSGLAASVLRALAPGPTADPSGRAPGEAATALALLTRLARAQDDQAARLLAMLDSLA